MTISSVLHWQSTDIFDSFLKLSLDGQRFKENAGKTFDQANKFQANTKFREGLTLLQDHFLCFKDAEDRKKNSIVIHFPRLSP